MDQMPPWLYTALFTPLFLYLVGKVPSLNNWLVRDHSMQGQGCWAMRQNKLVCMKCLSLNEREPSRKWQMYLLEWAAAAGIAQGAAACTSAALHLFLSTVGMEMGRAPLRRGSGGSHWYKTNMAVLLAACRLRWGVIQPVWWAFASWVSEAF